MEAHDGRTRLHGPASRPLVVGFANPKKIRPGEPPEPAIAPRKLFIGQVSALNSQFRTTLGGLIPPGPVHCMICIPSPSTPSADLILTSVSAHCLPTLACIRLSMKMFVS